MSNRHSKTDIKQFGYLLSALLIVLTVISQYKQWPATPWLYLLTLYFLTGSLWIPVLIKPFYLLFTKFIVKTKRDSGQAETLKKINKN
ncbi:MAG: hypothetical protein JXR46_00360 [Calditrichaceae bacterium]|nr:hypothetical protein [Calditrichaceae bacterium]MBN2707465.1 hypothetical protein [Calditrichaceae bacterium]RQV94032.1 MAG: hypothetical protein EH224_11355 [Calditrichota bacterium]